LNLSSGPGFLNAEPLPPHLTVVTRRTPPRATTARRRCARFPCVVVGIGYSYD